MTTNSLCRTDMTANGCPGLARVPSSAICECSGIDFGPDAAQDQHAEVQDDLQSVAFPAHSGKFDPLREQRLAGGLGHAAADGKPRFAECVIAHPGAAPPQV
jgi:hypothetical protein